MFRYRCILVITSKSIVSILNSQCNKIECVVLGRYIVKYLKVKGHDVGN